MRQALMTEPGKIEFRQVEIPTIGNHEILMQTKRIGICGSDIHMGFVQDRELKLAGTLMYQKHDYEKAIELASSGEMCLDELLTHRFKYDQYLEAYQAIEESNGEYMKVMVEFD